MGVMRFRTGSWIFVAVSAGFVAPLACAPSSDLPPTSTNTLESTTGAGGASGASTTTTANGTGGDLFEGGPSCTDPKDDDGDFIANTLELAPAEDTDKDGTPDYLDDDSDGDGYSDK